MELPVLAASTATITLLVVLFASWLGERRDPIGDPLPWMEIFLALWAVTLLFAALLFVLPADLAWVLTIGTLALTPIFVFVRRRRGSTRRLR